MKKSTGFQSVSTSGIQTTGGGPTPSCSSIEGFSSKPILACSILWLEKIQSRNTLVAPPILQELRSQLSGNQTRLAGKSQNYRTIAGGFSRA